MPGMVKKDRERDRSHVGHACQPRIRIVMPGMKMNKMSCKKRTRKNSANQFLFKKLPLALEKINNDNNNNINNYNNKARVLFPQ